MAISNLSSGVRTGVCLSTNRPTTPYEGQVIYETDTDRLYVWNGTAWVIPNSPAQNPTGLELVTTCTVTSAGGTSATASGGVVTIGTSNTSVTVSSAFSTTFDNYKIILSGGTTSVSDATLSLRLGSETTGYYLAQSGVDYAGATTSNTSANNDAYWLYVGRCRTNGNNMNIDVCAPFLGNLTYITGAVANANTGRNFAGYLNTTASYTAFTVNVDSATITGGTIRVYGYRNS